MKNKVLITGANGFVGRHLIERALQDDYDVVAAVRESSDVARIEDLPCKIVRINYGSSKSISTTLAAEGHFEYVIHNAGVTQAIDLEAYRSGNVEVTRNLLRALQDRSLLTSNFVYISSLAARGPNYQGYDDPISDYGKSKFEAEQVVKDSQLPFVIIRPTAVFGSGDKAFLELVKIIKGGISLTIGSKKQQLTFVHGVDLAKIVFEAKAFTGKTFYASDGNLYPQTELVMTIKSLLAKQFTLPVHIPTGLVKAVSLGINGIYNHVLNRSWHYNPPKVRELTATDWSIHDHPDQKLLNFAPEYSLRSGFAEAIEYYKKNGWL